MTTIDERERQLKKMQIDMSEALQIVQTMAHNMQAHIRIWEREDNDPKRHNP